MRSLARKIWAPLALLGALVLKFKTALLALLKLKLLATSASMLVSVTRYPESITTQITEPRRELWGLLSLRGWSDEPVTQVSAGGS